jgi:hypothetical protein
MEILLGLDTSSCIFFAVIVQLRRFLGLLAGLSIVRGGRIRAGWFRGRNKPLSKIFLRFVIDSVAQKFCGNSLDFLKLRAELSAVRPLSPVLAC